MGFTLKRFDRMEDLNHAMLDCLTACFQLQAHTPYAVMLSGGRTPLAVYEELARRKIQPSAFLSLIYSDERAVPVDSPENNYRSTLPLLGALRLPPERILRVHTELGWHESAERYHAELERFLASGGRIPFGLLGLGADGHTASLFTAEDIDRAPDRFAVAIPKARKPDRVSVTPKLLGYIDRIVVLAAGPDKREIVDKLVNAPDDVVAGMALRELCDVEIWNA